MSSKSNGNKLTNSTDDQYLLRPATLWGIPFVAEVLPIFEENYPDDLRPRQSLEVATKYVQGESEDKSFGECQWQFLKLVKK